MDDAESQPVYHNPNLLIIFAVTLSAVMGVASVTPAFPDVAEALDVSKERIGWLVTIFYVPGLVLAPLLGYAADRWGRKTVLAPSLLLFSIAGSACALAPNFEWLLALRFVQGMGSSSLASMNLTIIGDLFSGDRRTAAMGYNASVLSVGTASYPIIGGALALMGWYYPFALPILALPIGLLVIFKLDNPEPDGVEEIGTYLSRLRDVLWHRRVIGIFVLTVVTFALLFGPYLTYFPILLETRFEASSFTIGLVLSTVSIASGVTSAQLGDLVQRFDERHLLTTAFALYTISFALVPFATSLWLMLVPTLCYGVAQALNIPTLQSMLAGIAPREQRAAFMSLNSLVYRIGQTLGPLVAGGVYAYGSIDTVYWAASALAVLSFAPLIGMVWQRHGPEVA